MRTHTDYAYGLVKLSLAQLGPPSSTELALPRMRPGTADLRVSSLHLLRSGPYRVRLWRFRRRMTPPCPSRRQCGIFVYNLLSTI